MTTVDKVKSGRVGIGLAVSLAVSHADPDLMRAAYNAAREDTVDSPNFTYAVQIALHQLAHFLASNARFIDDQLGEGTYDRAVQRAIAQWHAKQGATE